MAGVKDGSETDTGEERPDGPGVDVIIHNVAVLLVIDGVDDLIVAIILITVEILCLTTVT